jgi:hypothetical protein
MDRDLGGQEKKRNHQGQNPSPHRLFALQLTWKLPIDGSNVGISWPQSKIRNPPKSDGSTMTAHIAAAVTVFRVRIAIFQAVDVQSEYQDAEPFA